MSLLKGQWPILSAFPGPSIEGDTDLQSFSESLVTRCFPEFRFLKGRSKRRRIIITGKNLAGQGWSICYTKTCHPWLRQLEHPDSPLVKRKGEERWGINSQMGFEFLPMWRNKVSSCSPRAVLQERASGLRCGPCKVKAHANEIRKIDTRVLGRAPALPIIQQPGKFQATSWNQTHILLQNIRIPVNEIKGSSELMYLRAGRMVK